MLIGQLREVRDLFLRTLGVDSVEAAIAKIKADADIAVRLTPLLNIAGVESVEDLLNKLEPLVQQAGQQ